MFVVSRPGRTLAALSLLAVAAFQPLPAQTPTVQGVQSALQQPGVGARVRQQIITSGLTPDQIHERLQAAGYPATLLDSYMPGSDTTAGANPGQDVLTAMRFLGLVDSSAASAIPPGAPGKILAAAAKSDSAGTSTLSIFGLDLFRRSTSQFEPELAGPVDENYQLGPRDVLEVILTGEVERSYSLEVSREGYVVVPQAGQVYVANLTLGQAEEQLATALRRVYSSVGTKPGNLTHLYVTVAKLRTNQVFVIGEVGVPGSYEISSVGTMLTALYAAGGPTDNGSLRDVELRRNGKLVGTLDVYDYLLRGDASHDVRLQTGDVLFVPVHGPRVAVRGEVIRPAIYEMTKGETLRDVIRDAGGFTATAVRSRVLLRRIVPPDQRPAGGGRDRTVIEVQSAEFANGAGPAVPVEDGDEVDVFPISDRLRNHIIVDGAVWNPGSQGFTPGMKISDALRAAGGVKPDVTDLLISRLMSDQVREQLRTTFRDSLGDPRQNLELQEDDSIVVYAQRDFRPDRWVAITGAVRNGGQYPWREGMTLRDLVHMAGGLQDGAYLGDARVARLIEDRSGGKLATEFEVPLDSTYLLERGLDGSYYGPPGMPPKVAVAPEVQLQPYDNALILRQPNWEVGDAVTVLGEVQFPGTYSLLSKTERITDVIARAGGFTTRAYLDGLEFRRSEGGLGRVAVDLRAAIADPSSRNNFTLLSGDTLIVPQYRSTVKVEGAVSSPLTIAYARGKNLSYYVDASGGPNYQADVDRAYVIQPNGVVERYKHRFSLIPNSDPVPRPGSVVVVPTKDPNAHTDWASIAGAVAQILGSTVAIIAIASRL